MLPFVDRRRELRALDAFYSAPQAGLLVLYGRRRIGKTSLLTHWISQRFQDQRANQAFYWMATTQSAAYQLRDFSQALLRLDPRQAAPPAPDYALPSWEAAFNYLAELSELRAQSGPLVAVIDEFTYLAQSEPGLASLLQRAWDHRLSRAPHLRLILSGSLTGVMEQHVLSGQAPLYGRASTILRLRALEFGALAEIFPDPRWSADERVAVYAVCGGIPAYLDLFARAGSFSDGLMAHALAPDSILLTDAALLLNDRLDEPYVFESVLAAIASGYHEWNEIARMANVEEGSLGHYLQTLQALDLVKRDQPVLTPRGGRRGRYYVSDPFLRFYYRFIVPHRGAIQRGLLGRTVQTIIEDLRGFIGTYVFEDLCRDYVLAQAEKGRLGWMPEEYGAYWRRQRGESVQLDVVAASSRARRLLIGEAKWGEDAVGRGVLTDLVARSHRMPEVAAGWRAEYALFARAGFTDAARQEAQHMGAQLVDLRAIEQAHVELVEMAG